MFPTLPFRSRPIQFQFRSSSQIRLRRETHFHALLKDLIQDPRVRRMEHYIQHGSTSTYTHVIQVAHTAYQLNHRLHLRVNDRALIRASILHDYYLYDWHTHGDKLHGFHHARIAATNARHDFHISPAEEHMILCHMWPLNFFSLPRSKGAWILTAADKIVSTRETFIGFFENSGN